MKNLYRKAALDGNNDAAWWLAKNFFYGKRLPKDYEEAFYWLNVLFLRKSLSPKAGLLLGLCYFNGSGVTADYNAAVKRFLGALESSGRDRWGVPVRADHSNSGKDPDDLTETDVRTICRLLGECYYYGKGVAKDYCRALKYLLLSVRDEDYMYPDKDAEYLIGTCYYFHRGTHQNISEALFWLNDAEQQGSTEARELLERRARRQRK